MRGLGASTAAGRASAGAYPSSKSSTRWPTVWNDRIIHELVANTGLDLASQSPAKRRHIVERVSRHALSTSRRVRSSTASRCLPSPAAPKTLKADSLLPQRRVWWSRYVDAMIVSKASASSRCPASSKQVQTRAATASVYCAPRNCFGTKATKSPTMTTPAAFVGGPEWTKWAESLRAMHFSIPEPSCLSRAFAIVKARANVRFPALRVA